MTHPAQQAPSDILQKIFTEAVDDESEALNIRASTLVSCSQVCNQWRHAALSNTRSWAQIIDFNRSSTTWINELLKRSHRHGVEFGSEGKAGPVFARNIDSNKITLLLSHASRVQTFCFKADPPELGHTVTNSLTQRLFELPLPSLKCLYITLYEVPQIMQTFLHGNATQLRKLCIISMSGCLRALLSEIMLPSLEELAVEGAGRAPNVQEWVRILSTRTPNLKRLDLGNAIATTEEFDGSTVHTNRETSDLLPNLEEISLDELHIAPCIDFINALRPPSTCTIKIDGYSWEVEHDAHLLSELIRSRVQAWPSEIPNRFLVLEIGYEIQQMFYSYEAEITISNRFETSDKRLLQVAQNLKIPTKDIARLDPGLFIHTTFIASTIAIQEHFASILSIFHKMEGTFATTTTLRIRHCDNSKAVDGEYPNAEYELESLGLKSFLFARLSNIEVLMLSGDALFPIIPILMQDSSTITPYFPRLKSLVVEIYEQKADEAVQGSYFSITQAFLLQRKEQGFPVQTVHLLVLNANDDLINGFFSDLCHLVVINFAEGAA